MKKAVQLLFAISLFLGSEKSISQSSWQWAHLLTSVNNDAGFENLSVDKSGNSYIMGECNTDISIDSLTTINSDSYSLIVMKLNTSGSVVWTKMFPKKDFFSSRATSIAAKENGGCYVTGFFIDSLTFDNHILYDTIGHSFFLNLDSAGNVVWVTEAHGSTGGISVRCDTYNQPVFIGNYTDSCEIGGYGFVNNTTMSSGGAYIVKMDENGNVIWTNNIKGEAFLSPNCFTISETGEVYISADITGNTIFNSDTINTIGVVLAKYDSSGFFEWVKNIITGQVSELSLSAFNNNIFCSGAYESYSTNFQTITLPLSVTGGGDFDGFIASYDSSGNVLWANHQFGNGNVWISDICHDSNGHIYFTGRFSGDSIIFSNSNQVLNKETTEYSQGFSDQLWRQEIFYH